MSELYREQYPLLRDDLSEEERYSPQYHRRLRPMTYKGRARIQVQGAAAIIKSWPDHWSTFIAYLWIGLGMLALTTFIVYNSLFAYTLLPTANSRLIKPMPVKAVENTSKLLPTLPDVYMHILVNNSEEVDLSQFLPYIEIVSSKYVNFKYHLIIVLNDTLTDVKSDGEHNDIALNSLWNNGISIDIPATEYKTSIRIERVTLSQYMNDSPLRKYWRSLPHQFTEFLLRAISIWEKGGVAFNPILLTPQSSNSVYIGKIHNILKKYETSHTEVLNNAQVKKKHENKRPKPKVNNIRDIIDALEHENDSNNPFQQILVEAENRNDQTVPHGERKLLSLTEVATSIPLENELENFKTTSNLPGNITKRDVHRKTDVLQELEGNNTSTAKLSLLPLFLEYLFYNKPIKQSKPVNDISTNSLSRKRKSITIIQMENAKENATIISTDPLAKDEVTNTQKAYISNDKDMEYIKKYNNGTDNNKNKLSLDLKGNIIATKTACHAFIGTIFSNIIHHTEEDSLSELIITEVLLFCKGVLSSCEGIDLIFL